MSSIITTKKYFLSKKRKKEISLISNSSNTLCIGGGCIPATAILFAKYTKNKITVIDNDLSTINYSKNVIRKLKLEDFIEVKFIDGVNVNLDEFNLIHLANQVTNKDVIINNFNKGNLLVRVPKNKIKNLYDSFESNKDSYSFINQPFYSNISRTILYVK